MQRLLITIHMHLMALILGVIFIPLLIALVRAAVLKKAVLDPDASNKIRLDVATVIPVGVLLWNLCIFYASNIMSPAVAVEATPKVISLVPADLPLTFEKCVAAAGESTVALAAAIIFARLFGSIWNDAWR